MSACQFCNKTFCSVSQRNYHQKTAKYCLKIQNELNEEKKETVSTIMCEYCNKVLSIYTNLKVHHNSCERKKIIETTNSIKKECEDAHKKEIETMKMKYELKLNSQIAIIQELRKQIKELSHKKEKSISSSTINSNNKSTVTNINVTQIIGATDMSQSRFDQLISEKFTYDLFQKGSYAGKKILIDYFTDELGILRIELCDDARNKLKIIDKESGKEKIIDPLTLFEKFSNSNTLHTFLQDYKNKYCNSTNYTVQGGIQMTKKVLSFQNDKRFVNTVYKYFKSHVREFGQLVTLTEATTTPMLTNLFETTENEY